MKAGTKIKFWYWTGAVAFSWLWIPSMIYTECLTKQNDDA